MSRDDHGGGSLVAAFLIGAVAGAAVALLLAPATGEEMRRRLGERAREGREKAEEAARQGREFVNRQRDQVSTAVERGREQVSTAVERGREAYQRARGREPHGGEQA
jgi:gas vesicle protein